MRNPAGSVKDRLAVALIEDAEKRGVLRSGETPGEITVAMSEAINLYQFNNPAYPKLHRDTRGPEIWRDSGGCVDVFVSALGTGGTLSGIGQSLKAHKPSVRIADTGEGYLTSRLFAPQPNAPS